MIKESLAYTLEQLKKDIENIGIPLFEVVINSKIQLKVKPNSFIEHDEHLSFWIFNNKRYFFGLLGTIDQYECLKISKQCKLYVSEKPIYHEDLNCIKSISVYDESNNLLGNLYYPTHLY